MTNPRIAALAEALADIQGFWRTSNGGWAQMGMIPPPEEQAAAILDALPPGWRTPLHSDPAMEERCDGRCARDECICSVEAYADEKQRRREIVATIARLRPIEEAARELSVDEDGECDFDLILLTLRRAGVLGTTMQHVLALRAALEEKP